MGSSQQMLMASMAAAAGSNITADMWQDFEFATLSTGNLAANDHSASGSWSIADAGSKLSTNASGQKALISTVGGVSTAGTLGLKLDYNGTNAAYLQFNPTSYGANPVSHLTAIYVPALPADGIYEVAWSYPILHVEVRRSGATHQVFLSNANGSSSGITVTADAWYYFTWKAQRNATCRLRVYGMDGVQVGSEATLLGGDADYTNPLFGESNGHTARAVVFYFDNFCIDSTNAVFPLGP